MPNLAACLCATLGVVRLLIGTAQLTTAAAAAPKIHVIITFGKWMSAQWFTGSGANREGLTLRALVIDWTPHHPQPLGHLVRCPESILFYPAWPDFRRVPKLSLVSSQASLMTTRASFLVTRLGRRCWTGPTFIERNAGSVRHVWIRSTGYRMHRRKDYPS